MTANGWLQIGLFLGLLVALAKPLGWYMARVYEGKPCGLDRALEQAATLFAEHWCEVRGVAFAERVDDRLTELANGRRVAVEIHVLDEEAPDFLLPSGQFHLVSSCGERFRSNVCSLSG